MASFWSWASTMISRISRITTVPFSAVKVATSSITADASSSAARPMCGPDFIDMLMRVAVHGKGDARLHRAVVRRGAYERNKTRLRKIGYSPVASNHPDVTFAAAYSVASTNYAQPRVRHGNEWQPHSTRQALRPTTAFSRTAPVAIARSLRHVPGQTDTDHALPVIYR